jgi:predicted metalloprotease
MRWLGRRQSSNVEDRRGLGGRGIAVGGGIGTIVVLLVAVLLGADPRAILEQVQTGPGLQSPGAAPSPEEDRLAEFVKVVLADTEEVWHGLFQELGLEYREPTLVLFTGGVQSACGMAGSAVGPFYCPGDERVYIDLSFYRELSERFGAPGDFAQAYVIAHEVGHHVQNLLGTMEEARSVQRGLSRADANEISVRLELQADFYAGVWARYAERMGVLEPGDVEEALNAASAIGDDRLQRQTQGTIVPDSFTHGTSAQRMRWFRRGFETGDVRAGDTFRESDL